MKAKRKSLGEVVWDLCYGLGAYEWSKISEYERKDCRRIASRIRREVIRRELEKAEDAFGVRAIHGDSAERAKLMLESRRRERGQAAVILGREK